MKVEAIQKTNKLNNNKSKENRPNKKQNKGKNNFKEIFEKYLTK